MKEIIRTILTIEDEAKKKLEKANLEAETIRQQTIQKMTQLREQRFKELDTQLKLLNDTMNSETQKTIKNIQKSMQWELSVLEQKFKEKENSLIENTVKKVLPEEFRG